MHAKIVYIAPNDREPEEIVPENAMSFAITVVLSIGPAEGNRGEGDWFYLEVFTPQALLRGDSAFHRWGRGTLIVSTWDWTRINAEIERLVSSVSGDSWSEVARQLCRYFSWEYDDYREEPIEYKSP